MRRTTVVAWTTRGTSLLAAFGLLVVVGVVAPAGPANAAPATNSFAALYNSYGSADSNQLFPSSASNPIVVRSIPQGIEAVFASSTDIYDLELAAPNGAVLSDGLYAEARPWTDQASGSPTMTLLDNYSPCNQGSATIGTFDIKDIAYDNGIVTRLAVSFVQHCVDQPTSQFGDVSYNEPASGPLAIEADTLLLPGGYAGVPSPHIPIWVTNPGTSPVAVGAVRAAGLDANDIDIVADTCPTTLAPAATCVIMATVAPGAVGPRQSSISVASGSSTLAVSVTETGLAANAAFVLDGAPTGSSNESAVVDNQYNSTIQGSGTASSIIFTDGASASIVRIDPPTGESLGVGVYDNVTAGDSATSASVTFIELGDGVDLDPDSCDEQFSGELNVYSIAFDAAGNLTNFAADLTYPCARASSDETAQFRVESAFGYSAIREQPDALDLGYIVKNTTSPTQQATITNPGDVPLATSVSIAGINPSLFGIVSTTCSAARPLAPGGSCSVTIGFAPTDYGNFSATLVITDNTLLGQHTVGLNGTGDIAPYLSNPSNGQMNVDTTMPFSWTTSPRVEQIYQGFYLIVGTTPGSANLVNSGVLPGNQLYYYVPTMPTGRTLYATLSTEVQGQWSVYDSITFQAKDQAVKFVYPVPTQAGINSNITQPITWTTNSSVQGYYLVVGTSPGSGNLINSGALPATRYSYQPPALPAYTALYATLLVKYNGNWNTTVTIAFNYQQVGEATFTNPLNGQVGPTTTCCAWSYTSSAQAYYLEVGTSPETPHNLVNSGVLPPMETCYPANCALAEKLPRGVPLYATIVTEVGGSWSRYQSITFTER